MALKMFGTISRGIQVPPTPQPAFDSSSPRACSRTIRVGSMIPTRSCEFHLFASLVAKMNGLAIISCIPSSVWRKHLPKKKSGFQRSNTKQNSKLLSVHAQSAWLQAKHIEFLTHSQRMCNASSLCETAGRCLTFRQIIHQRRNEASYLNIAEQYMTRTWQLKMHKHSEPMVVQSSNSRSHSS